MAKSFPTKSVSNTFSTLLNEPKSCLHAQKWVTILPSIFTVTVSIMSRVTRIAFSSLPSCRLPIVRCTLLSSVPLQIVSSKSGSAFYVLYTLAVFSFV